MLDMAKCPCKIGITSWLSNNFFCGGKAKTSDLKILSRYLDRILFYVLIVVVYGRIPWMIAFYTKGIIDPTRFF